MLERDRHRARDDEAPSLHDQPQVDRHRGLRVGPEALLRGTRPVHGVLPAIFGPFAEETGLVVAELRYSDPHGYRSGTAGSPGGNPPDPCDVGPTDWIFSKVQALRSLPGRPRAAGLTGA